MVVSVPFQYEVVNSLLGDQSQILEAFRLFSEENKSCLREWRGKSATGSPKFCVWVSFKSPFDSSAVTAWMVCARFKCMSSSWAINSAFYSSVIINYVNIASKFLWKIFWICKTRITSHLKAKLLPGILIYISEWCFLLDSNFRIQAIALFSSVYNLGLLWG